MARSPPRRRHTGHTRDYRDSRSDRRRSTSRDRRHNDRHWDQYDGRRDRDRYNGRRDNPPSSRHDEFRPQRRDRSPRERKRSREPDSPPQRDSHRRSHENYRRDRDKHEESDRKRQKRDSSVNRGENSRPSTGTPEARTVEDPKKSEKSEIEKSKAEKLAKVEAWKKSRLLQQSEAAAADSPVAATVPSTAGTPVTSDLTTNDGTSVAIPEDVDLNRPRPKFDHKEIKKRAAEKIQQNKRAILGDDAVLPTQIQEKVEARSAADRRPFGRAKDAAEFSGFGLSTSASERNQDKAVTATEAATAFHDDDGNVKRKFQKLPDLPIATGDDDHDMDGGLDAQDDEFDDDLMSDGEGAEAAREAILKRAEHAEIRQNDNTVRDTGVVLQQSATPADNSIKQADNAVADEEIDPLDAFMENLTNSMTLSSSTANTAGTRHNRAAEILGSDRNPQEDAVAPDEDPKNLLINPKRNKKDIAKVDHSKIDYLEFRKNFYTESPELAEFDEEEVQALRDELDGIKPDKESQDVPTPIVKWSQGGFSVHILQILQQKGLETPTSIQSQALPAIMSGRDFIGIAKTGSGKTLAFILPMFRHIQDQRRVAAMEGPIGLILAPTRELAIQIFKMCKPFLDAAKLRGACAYGGAPIKDQIAELKRGAEVVVCTPGRMIDLLAANSGRVTNLQRVTYCVLDEADRMFDMGFQPQLDKILENIRPDRQLVLFSATFPTKMETTSKKYMKDRILITVGGRSVVAPEITQIVEVRSEDTKFTRVLELLGTYLYEDDGKRVVIFVERQETADMLFVELGRNKYPSVSYHGGREQIDRDQAVSDFKAGHIPILVATSVAARGLDVKQLDLVIQYDCPNHREDYVHRAGRTGRAGNKGTAVTFVTPTQERYASFIVQVLKESEQDVPSALQDMATSFAAKVKSGEVKQRRNAGFAGRGVQHLEEMRQAERDRERKQYKTGDEPDTDDENSGKKEEKKSQIDEKIAKAAGVVKDRDAQPEPSANSGMWDALADKLNNGWNFVKHEKPAEELDPLAKVQAAAARIANRVGARGATRPGAPIDHRGPDAGAFSATLEVNDFPQKARWAVTNRTNVFKILEATGTSITSKGVYYAAGTEPGPNDEPKLYVLVEGDTEIAVKSAMRELTTHLREGTEQALELQNRSGGAPGRYSVV